MKKELHTVLGATGAAGRMVLHELQRRNLPVRAVGRNVNIENVENIKADILKREEALKAIQGSRHVYLCTALTYSYSSWKTGWPLQIKNVIEACLETDSRLIFLDNIYMYGPAPLSVPFDEDHTQLPLTKKGRIRKQVSDMVLYAVREKKLKAVIGRSADFYGPNSVSSAFYFTFIDRMLKGKAPQSIAKGNVKHTYSNTADIGRALVLLALDESTYGEVWHLPVDKPITVEELLILFNNEFGTNYKASYMPDVMRKILSLFIPPLKEISEMLYQFNEEYIMSCEKFKNHFPDFKVTPYETGIREMIKSFK